MKLGKIDVTKIKKEHLFKGQKGTFLNITLHENKDGTDQYGNDGFITQGVSKEARERGEKGPIIGNWRRLKPKGQAAPRTATAPAVNQDGPPTEDDDIPF
jgi:hypothetical protein